MRPYLKGLLITLAGVAVITPDTLLVRLMSLDTYTILFWRGVLSGTAILIGMFLLAPRNFLPQLRAIGGVGWLMAAIFAVGTLFFIYSVTHTLVANTLFLTSTSPVFAALIAWGFLGERPDRRTWATIAATLFGIGLIASGSLDGTAHGGTLIGDAAALIDAVLLAATFAIARARRASSMVPAMGLSGFLTAGLALLVGGAPAVVAGADVLWIGLLGLLVAPLGFALLTTGPRYLPAPDVSLLLLLEAITAPLLVWLVVEEVPGARTLAGGAIVVAALAISNLYVLSRRSKAANPDQEHPASI